MIKTKLSPPWITYYRKIQQLLSQDSDVFLMFDQEEMIIRIYVGNAAKAQALEQLMVQNAAFGNVTVSVEIIPPNERPAATGLSVYEEAFAGNPVFMGTREITLPVAGSLRYVVWTRDVAQFYNDNLADYNGNTTVLMEEIAREVLIPEPGVFHCTADLIGSL